MKKTDEAILRALGAGCKMFDEYEAGYKSRRAFQWYFVQLPDGSDKKSVSKSATRRLRYAGLIEGDYRNTAYGVDWKIELSLTDAGREAAVELPPLDLKKHFAEKKPYWKPAERAVLEKIRAGVDASEDGWFDLIADGSCESLYTWTLLKMRDAGLVTKRPDRKYYGSPLLVSITDAGRAVLAKYAKAPAAADDA
ncbi:hypothetical protein [Bradyrhizobium sp. SBR1B]|uniref:hypothetical protein n=1 Tax=Bradyrhizobium sp. SBR1B TaxID=2663836 RepID=UPI001606B90A|nr:hypothetical protein [Bradyrhizobium sp. SBR1B]MBB4377248.1 hypothetical protein [Bradyrhizobium sp. SBR1B]